MHLLQFQTWLWLDWLGVTLASAIALTAVSISLSAYHFLQYHQNSDAELDSAQNSHATILPTSSFIPHVTILKPIKGYQSELAANLASFLNLEDIPYEILIGIADEDDPSAPIAQQFITDHPDTPVRLIFTHKQLGLNPKIVNLMGLESQIRGEIILISDACTRAHPQSLRLLVDTFTDPNVGWACAPYCVLQPKILGTKLRAIFMGSQLAAIIGGIYKLTGTAPTMGSWLAIRKQAIVDMGGLITLSPFLAEDGAIVLILQQLGWKGSVIPDRINVCLGDWDFQQAWAQATRWARLIRVFNPFGPWILLLLNGTFWFLLGTMSWITGARAGGLGLAITGLIIWLCNSFNYAYLGGSIKDLALLPLSDLTLMLVFFSSYLSNKVTWRGQHFYLGQNSRILPVK